jgi:dsDNA-specific endonuclease/ATPase MutS2
VKNSFFDEDALIFPLIAHDIPERRMLVPASDIQAAMNDRKTEERRKPQPAEKKPHILEVDLHINQLVDMTTGMDNTAMLNCQLSKFHETMKANAAKKGQRIVFIHGKGEGVLRAALEKEMKTAYKHLCRFQDASFREYGFGATQVTIF